MKRKYERTKEDMDDGGAVVHDDGLGDDLQFLHLGGGVLVHLLGTGTGEGVLDGDDEVGLAELLDNLCRQKVVPRHLAPRHDGGHVGG